MIKQKQQTDYISDDETYPVELVDDGRNGYSRRPKVNPGIAAAVAVAGGQVELARRLGVTQAAICHWAWKSCPAERAVQIEQEVGVNRRAIRPDLFLDAPLVRTKVREQANIPQRYEKAREDAPSE